jgi:hypothetical protein
VGSRATISGHQETLPDPDSLKGGTPTKLINVFLRRMWTGQFRSKPCSHVYLARADTLCGDRRVDGRKKGISASRVRNPECCREHLA